MYIVEDGKYQELIQSITIPDPEHQMNKWRKLNT